MKRHFPNTILPRYRAAAQFVYFNDLIESTQNISLNNHKMQLYNDVMTNLINPASSIFNVNEQNNNEVITSAIQFLKNRAQPCNELTPSNGLDNVAADFLKEFQNDPDANVEI